MSRAEAEDDCMKQLISVEDVECGAGGVRSVQPLVQRPASLSMFRSWSSAAGFGTNVRLLHIAGILTLCTYSSLNEIADLPPDL
jgi:hypothetical protein